MEARRRERSAEAASSVGSGEAMPRKVFEKFFLWINFVTKIIERKGIFTLKLRKPGLTEQSRDVSECITKCNFFMQTH